MNTRTIYRNLDEAPETSNWVHKQRVARRNVVARLAAGEPPFRPNTKRAAIHQKLIEGVKFSALLSITGWKRGAIEPELGMIAELLNRPVYVSGVDDPEYVLGENR